MRSLVKFSSCTNPIIHLFYLQKICIGIVLYFPWNIFMSQEKLQKMILQFFFGGGGGGGGEEVYHGIRYDTITLFIHGISIS